MTGEKDKSSRAEQRSIPVYPHSAQYAREHGELDAYRASAKADLDCKTAIEDAIREHYRDNRLDPACVSQVTGLFGSARVMRVLANTIRQKEWDARFSRDNKAWAHTVSIIPNPDVWGEDRNLCFVVESHPGLTDLFVTEARKEFAKAQEKPESRGSVLARLQTPLAKPTAKSDKTGTREL